ncbi:hypothetical protein CLOSTMETH_02899 [[Clostridium] methylpentosum DSM 5476]|uniref:Uncharacterized protein n=1 Tax=[Clostridium] methylpentosum DSM 5476 TaxID=537013 RepID=C0EGA6_9FIRM|nr:hypothetical protein CLOSTMETH_02899 [[Clostridium] methylpentosum DSM 5476]
MGLRTAETNRAGLLLDSAAGDKTVTEPVTSLSFGPGILRDRNNAETLTSYVEELLWKF